MKANNSVTNEDITITFTGQFVVSRSALASLMVRAQSEPAPPPSKESRSSMPDDGGALPRLAYTMRETAAILGVSYITVYRLLQRRLLRSSLATRTKMISKKEIERFLAATV
jgi:hypothetical protein